MAVEITGVPGTPLTITQSDKVDPSNTSTNTHSNTVAIGTPAIDAFTVSARAEELRIIESSVNAQPVVDDVLVKDLKLEIDAGRYDIDPLRVAEKLIALEIQLVA